MKTYTDTERLTWLVKVVAVGNAPILFGLGTYEKFDVERIDSLMRDDEEEEERERTKRRHELLAQKACIEKELEGLK